MAKLRVKDIVEELVKPIVEALGLELVDVEYQREGKELFLRIYIYKVGGVLIEDCVEVNKQIEDELDRVDPIKDPYTLEVSSPGLDRPFRSDRDFERYMGEVVEVQLYEAEDGTKFFEGKLVGLNSNSSSGSKEVFVVLNIEDTHREFQKSKVATVKRKIIF